MLLDLHVGAVATAARRAGSQAVNMALGELTRIGLHRRVIAEDVGGALNNDVAFVQVAVFADEPGWWNTYYLNTHGINVRINTEMKKSVKEAKKRKREEKDLNSEVGTAVGSEA
jgi:hypothetical protein